jgi:tRNA A37 threonylcarbamoyltransferase TsaD
VAVTAGPGLAACLRAGVAEAAGLARRARAPLVPVHHLEAHLLVPRLAARLAEPSSPDPLPFPYLVLLVSGGHSQLLLARRVGDYALLGRTLDDSLGEAFDKVARLLRVWLHVPAPRAGSDAGGGGVHAAAAAAGAPGHATAAAEDVDTGLTPAALAEAERARQAAGAPAPTTRDGRPQPLLHFVPFIKPPPLPPPSQPLEAGTAVSGAAAHGVAASDAEAAEAAAEAAALAAMGGHLGAAVEALAAQHAPDSPVRVAFPVPLRSSPLPPPSGGVAALAAPAAAFSFSGLKSAVHRWSRRPGVDVRNRATAAAGAAAFQAAAAAHVCDQLRRALTACDAAGERVTAVVMAGGVAANTALRTAVTRAAATAPGGARVVSVPPARYCTDNAVMVAWAAAERIAAGLPPPHVPSNESEGEALEVRARWPLAELSGAGGVSAPVADAIAARRELAAARQQHQQQQVG